MEMSIPPPPPGTDIYASQQPHVLAATFITWVLAILAVILRFAARRKSNAPLWWDDWLMVVALVFSTAACFTSYGMMVRSGLGRHIWAIQPAAWNYKNLFMGLFILQLMYVTEIVLVKISILLFYWRIFNVSSIRLPIYIISALVVLWGVSTILVICLQCIPVQGIWDKSINPACNVNPHEFYMGYIIPNIVMDLMILALPLPYIWRLKINLRKKFAISGLFLLGGFVVTVSIVRFVFFMKSDVNAPDIFWNLTNSDIWSIVELNMALVSGCLPSLGPFLRLNSGGSSNKSGRTSNSMGSRLRLLASKLTGTRTSSQSKKSDFLSTQNSTHTKNQNDGFNMTQQSKASYDSERPALEKLHDNSSSEQSSKYIIPLADSHNQELPSSRILVRDDFEVTSVPARMV